MIFISENFSIEKILMVQNFEPSRALPPSPYRLDSDLGVWNISTKSFVSLFLENYVLITFLSV